MAKVRIKTLQSLKKENEKIVCLTSYDASSASLASKNGIEVLLVGDSLGMVVQGQQNTLPVTVEHMAYHTQAVNRGNTDALVLTDLPFLSYTNPKQSLISAKELMQAGAEMVKLEGGAHLVETVKTLTQHGVPVCGHLGLLPQSVHYLSGYSQQATTAEGAKKLLTAAELLQAAGIQMLVVECIPAELAQKLTKILTIPVIGIGTGSPCDGQVLVWHDLLGLSEPAPKFAKNFLHETQSIAGAVKAYSQAVKQGRFPITQ